MLSPTAFKRKISVRFYLRLTAKNQNGMCPVRLTARWHGEEMQRDTGEVVLPERSGKGGVRAVSKSVYGLGMGLYREAPASPRARYPGAATARRSRSFAVQGQRTLTWEPL